MVNVIYEVKTKNKYINKLMLRNDSQELNNSKAFLQEQEYENMLFGQKSLLFLFFQTKKEGFYFFNKEEVCFFQHKKRPFKVVR